MAVSEKGKKIFFTDIDETLVNTDKSLSEENRRALEAYVNTGSYLVISTGRVLCASIRLLKDLGIYDFPNTFISTCNGGLIYDTGSERVISDSLIPLDLVTEVFRCAGEFGIHIQTYTDTEVVSEKDTPDLHRYCAIQKMPPLVVSHVEDVLRQSPAKILAIDYSSPEHVTEFRNYLEPKVNGTLDLYKSNPYLLEIVRRGVNKGSALRFMADYLSVPVENTISAGDEENDLTMIQAAGIGCAMCNGKDSLKEIADYVTENDNNHGGVAEILYKFCI
jgi:Cof subfamily protein (haloacid dehalogenase superfamily)